MQQHDQSQVGKPATNPVYGKETSGRQDEMAAWTKTHAEGQAIAEAYNGDPTSVGKMTASWAWKGYGFRIDIPVPAHAVTPTHEEIIATEKPAS